MSNFDFKNVVKRNIILREGWQDVGDDPVDGMAGEHGLTSDDNKESLMNLLDDIQDDIGLEDEQKVELIGLMRDLAQEHDVVLEQSLKGLQSEKDRVIPAKTILDFLNGLGLDTTKTRKLVKTLDQWAKYNSVRFDSRPTDMRPSDKTSPNNIDRKKTPPKPEQTKTKGTFKTGYMQPDDEEVEIVPAGQEFADDKEKEDSEDSEESTLTKALDGIQAGLDAAGVASLFPPLAVLATPASIASLLLNLSRGKFGWALFDLIAIVPVVGGAAKAGKLGKSAKAAAVAGKWKTGKALIKTLGSADKARKVLDAAGKGRKAMEVAQATKGAAYLIGEMIPDEVWSQIENAEIPDIIANKLPEEQRKKPLVDWILDTLAEADMPFLDGKVEGLRDAWAEVKREMDSKRSDFERADTEELPRQNLKEQKYKMLLKRFKINENNK